MSERQDSDPIVKVIPIEGTPIYYGMAMRAGNYDKEGGTTEEEKVAKMYRAGLTYNEIAAEVGKSKSAVSHIIDKYKRESGLKARRAMLLGSDEARVSWR